MISYRECQRIAKEYRDRWEREEYERRVSSVVSTPFGLDQEEIDRYVNSSEFLSRQTELRHLAQDAYLSGLYLPPTPEIPSFWKRLFMDEWIPEEPDSSVWKMSTKKYKQEHPEQYVS